MGLDYIKLVEWEGYAETTEDLKTSHCILLEEWQGKYEGLSSGGSKDMVYKENRGTRNFTQEINSLTRIVNYSGMAIWNFNRFEDMRVRM